MRLGRGPQEKIMLDEAKALWNAVEKFNIARDGDSGDDEIDAACKARFSFS